MDKRSDTPPSGSHGDLRLLNRFAISLLQQQTLEDLLWSMARNLGELMGLEDLVIYLVEGDRLLQRAAFGCKNPKSRQIHAPIVIPLGQGITGSVARSGVPEIVNDTSLDPRYIRDAGSGRSELTVPVIYHGRVIAVIDSEASALGGFTSQHLELTVGCANIAASRIASAIEENHRRAAEHQLQLAKEELEQRVATRTEALRQAVDRLHDEAAERNRLQAEALKVEKLESLGVLAGGLAHDFNNLLQGVLAHLEQIRHVSEHTAAVEPYVRGAEDACLRASDLTGQLQAFARGGAPVRRVHSLAHLLKETVGFCLSGSQVTPVFDLSSTLMQVSVDAGQISQVIQNLVLNAVDAMKAGGHLYVTASNVTSDGSNYVEVIVRDEGPGIPTELRDRIFDPYFTTKDSGQGLGLASAYGIVQRHGGHLIIDAPAAGAQFRLLLPSADPPAESHPHDAMPTGLPPSTILLMDDEDLVREGTAGLLESLGMTVLQASEGDEALRIQAQSLAKGHRIDLAFLDLTIPGGMGGTETLRRLRERSPSLKAVVCSGYNNTPVMAEPDRYGFQAILQKPYRIADLRRALATLLESESDGAAARS